MSGIEWGVRQRHLPTGTVQEYYLEDQADAVDEYMHMADMNPDRWEITFGYRTMAAEAGEFTECTAAAGAKAKAKDGGEIRPEILSDMISMTGTVIPPEVIATWTPAEREQAGEWVAAEYAHASDHQEVQRLPEPPFVTLAAEICGNPVMAQLASEQWVITRQQAAEHPSGPVDRETHAAVIFTAQAAITGLLVLLRERQPS